MLGLRAVLPALSAVTVVLISLGASPALAAVSLSETPANRATAVSGVPPVLTQPADMTLAAGETTDQELHASDGDGDPLTFFKSAGPGFMTVSTIDPGSGNALGNIHLAPGLSQSGTTAAVVYATDGTLTATQTFSISVEPTPVAPVLVAPADMTVHGGEFVIQTLYASDANGDLLTFSLLSGPPYASITTTDPTGTGELMVAPGLPVNGTVTAVVGVSDGLLTDQRSLMITVLPVNVAPVLVQPANMTVRVGETKDQQISASDENGDPLTFSMASGPAYMSVTTADAQAGIGTIHLAPQSGDAGAAIGEVRVTDGTLFDQRSFSIAATSTAVAGGGVIFSNFGPGKAFDSNVLDSWTINGLLGPNVGQQAIAHQFVPAVADTFRSAEVALVAFSGPDAVVVYLQGDSNGLPGPILEQIDVAGFTAIPSVFEATSVLRPRLQMGTAYWLTVVAGAANVLAGWSWNSTGDISTGTNFAGTQGGSPTGPWGLDTFGSIRGAFQINGIIPLIPAAFDLMPRTVNLKARGLYVTGYIQLPTGMAVTDIAVATVRLADVVPALSKGAVVGDHNRDGVPDLAVKFSRALLDPHLVPGMNRLLLTGALVSGERFGGASSVKVIAPPDQPLSVSVAPNPLNPIGILTFTTSKAGSVTIELFDIQGRLVRRLLEAQPFAEGSHEALIDGRGEAGQPLASGVYFYRVEAPGGNVTGRFAILK
jgi:hypothetical protein